LKLDLFYKLWSTQILFGYDTSSIGNIFPLSFQRVKELPNWMLYAT
jgi:hypothetical protein